MGDRYIELIIFCWEKWEQERKSHLYWHPGTLSDVEIHNLMLNVKFEVILFRTVHKISLNTYIILFMGDWYIEFIIFCWKEWKRQHQPHLYWYPWTPSNVNLHNLMLDYKFEVILLWTIHQIYWNTGLW